MAVHYSHQACDIVRKFRAAAISVVVNERKVVFQTDPCADRNHRRQQCRKIVIAGILVGVIRNQKGPPVEK